MNTANISAGYETNRTEENTPNHIIARTPRSWAVDERGGEKNQCFICFFFFLTLQPFLLSSLHEVNCGSECCKQFARRCKWKPRAIRRRY